MINNSVGKKSAESDKNLAQKARKPNENNGVYLSSHVKIFDPKTNQIFVQKRADD